MLVAAGAIAAASGLVLPRRGAVRGRGGPGRRGRPRPGGFAWFWVAFPVTCVLAAWWVGVSLAWVGNLGGSAGFFWDAFTAGPDTVQVLSAEQFHEMQDQDRLRRTLPIAVAVGAVASAWAWRRRRV